MIVRTRTARIVVGLAAASLVVTACGSRSGSSSPGTTSSGGSSSGTTKTVKIGLIAPLSGDLSAVGLGMKNSLDLAINQANAAGKIKGWKIQMDAQSDDAMPGPAQNAATQLAADDEVAGVVGTLNSSTALIAAPILSRAGIAMVSPANTNPSLTQGADYLTAKKRQFPTYFRTATTDAVQGPFAAQYVYNTLHITKVATVNDGKAYGKGLVQTFTAEFTKLGGRVTGAQTISDTDKNFSSVVTKLKPAGPQLVYYGGEYPQAGPLSGQMAQGGLKVPMMGGDGLYDPQYIKLGGRAADLATSVGAPIESLASGKSFVSSYQAANYPQAYGAYGGYTFDAANAIINALATTLPGATSVKDARAKIVEAVGSVKFAGVTGPVSFDQYGDATNKTLTAYKVTGGAWVAAKTGTVSD